MRKTKIIGTLGPSSDTPERVEALIRAGLDCARLNFSHGTHADHERLVRTVREAAERVGRPVAILQDLQGPKIRVDRMRGGQVELVAGAELEILTEPVDGTPDRISTNYAGLPRDVRPGHTILLDDGLISLEVLETGEGRVRTRVVDGGILKDRKGMNLPGSQISLPALTDKDRTDLALGCRLGVDFVALSFVQTPEDVRQARAFAAECTDEPPQFIAKLERPNAVGHLDAIISAADGLMIARGDLGVELPPQKVPIIQKAAIDRTNQSGKPVITATQMLESMTRAPRATRAEVSDVANAVFDGTDAVMLSGETASGAYPVEAVRMMAAIIEEVETSPRYRDALVRTFKKDLPTIQNAAARAAVQIAQDLGIGTIVVFSESGRSAGLISDYRPEARIIGFSPLPGTLRRMSLYWGVTPEPIRRFESTDEMFAAVEDYLVQGGLCRSGEPVVLVAGVPPNQRESTNLVKIHRVR